MPAPVKILKIKKQFKTKFIGNHSLKKRIIKISNKNPKIKPVQSKKISLFVNNEKKQQQSG